MLTLLPEDSQSVYKRYIEREVPKLLEHQRMMIQKYWPDWETARYGKEHDKRAGEGVFEDR